MEFIDRYRTLAEDFTTDVVIRPALRVNSLRDAAVQDRLQKRGVRLEKVPYLTHGYFYEAGFSLGATPEYLLGLYYLQGPLSQLVSELLAPKPGETILDMAAAPGSKTTHLAQLMRNEGVIFALDSNAARLEALQNNCERLGVRNVLAFKKDARFVADFDMTFDRVLLDAPCSGNFCAEDGWFAKRRLADVNANARLQRALLRAACTVVKTGGRVLYSTCSLEPEEDECVIDWVLRRQPEMRLEPLAVPLGDPGITAWGGKQLHESIRHARRFWPHRTGAEGFFIALLSKR
ncbi:RsmB/NOP family class I SAM-dependent RNA methyltransferase [Candidatus Woesearchaeota archaeon]|nr:MAG: RsmB/NOP family class I SAM-dependent RNA methyltransferase [Candidatus Woesearchaeota archaeon]